MNAKSTKSRRKSKPKKPYPDYPLYAHATGRWAKRIRGKICYFGPWDNPQAALERFNREWPYLSEGRTPPPVDAGDGCTIQLLCNAFLTSKVRKMERGELSQRSFFGYKKTTDILIDFFKRDRLVDDLRPDDFERLRSLLAKSLGPVSLGNQVQRIRSVFKYAYDDRLIDRPIRYGQSFTKPSRRILRLARQKNGKRLFEAEELRKIIDASDQPLRAMILLGINCGFGQSDLSSLPQSAFDFENGWIDYSRQKTGVERRIPLWKETIEAVQAAIESRPAAKDEADNGLAFVTKYGKRWVKLNKNNTPDDAVGKEFTKLLRKLNLKRPGVNFYALRHTFETIGGESKDQVAVNNIMGHVDSSMAGVYRESISGDRLKAVTDTVREWLWPHEKGEE